MYSILMAILQNEFIFCINTFTILSDFKSNAKLSLATEFFMSTSSTTEKTVTSVVYVSLSELKIRPLTISHWLSLLQNMKKFCVEMMNISFLSELDTVHPKHVMYFKQWTQQNTPFRTGDLQQVAYNHYHFQFHHWGLQLLKTIAG